MMSNEHLALRQQLYEAQGIYHQAVADYWAVAVARLSTEHVRRELQTLHTAAAALDTALDALLDNLRQQESTRQIEKEIQRTCLIQNLLAHELTLTPHAEEAT